MLHSDYRPLCRVSLPFANRQYYMHSFDCRNPIMPDGYEDYLTPVIDLCEAAGLKSGIVHMTVDEKIITAGMSQRRPKPHVDGCFMPQLQTWGQQPQPQPQPPGWLHNCNSIAGEKYSRMPVIVAASVSGCRAWRGEFDGVPDNKGDLSHIQHLLGKGEIIPPNLGYLLSPDCVHESMVFPVETQRTFLRLALPTTFRF